MLPAEQITVLIEAVRGGASAEVDLERQEIVEPQGRRVRFDFDPFQRECILNGLDEIARSLTHEDGIAAYEGTHPPRVDTLALAAS